MSRRDAAILAFRMLALYLVCGQLAWIGSMITDTVQRLFMLNDETGLMWYSEEELVWEVILKIGEQWVSYVGVVAVGVVLWVKAGSLAAYVCRKREREAVAKGLAWHDVKVFACMAIGLLMCKVAFLGMVPYYEGFLHIVPFVDYGKDEYLPMFIEQKRMMTGYMCLLVGGFAMAWQAKRVAGVLGWVRR